MEKTVTLPPKAETQRFMIEKVAVLLPATLHVLHFRLSPNYFLGFEFQMYWREDHNIMKKDITHPQILNDTEERGSNFKTMSSMPYSIPDVTIFEYCLGSTADKATLLKEVVLHASEDQLLRFAHELYVYSGCWHHGRQIMIATRLLEDCTKFWNSIARNTQTVRWENVIFEIGEQFMKISCCHTRSLTEQDFELLRRIAGCEEYMAQENLHKLWCWLYPIACTISEECIKELWNSASPKWIEGFITKEEAELSLHGPRSLQEPGTFILRFPTSRSWPHPDAGNLIVTYVGRDCTIHHRLLSLEHIYRYRENEMKPLQEMLLEDPELSRLGRVIRSE